MQLRYVFIWRYLRIDTFFEQEIYINEGKKEKIIAREKNKV